MRNVNKQKLKKILLTVVLVGAAVFLFLILLGTVAQATGLVDDTVDGENLYSKYALSNYQLDFFVDTSWDWLPWNWKDGIGNQVQYGLYAIANFIWTISLYLSNATGYLVQQAYILDFISDTAQAIGENMQTLAGVTSRGFSSSGFYVGFLLIFILVVGIYVAYIGLMKRETSKAIHAVLNFLAVFILSASFIAYAPSYIAKINDFSSDISQASLDLGSRIILPNSDSKREDSVDMIRDTLFSVQVEQPWLLLQFDNSDKEEIGVERVENLVSVSPDTNKGEDREAAVKTEIEDYDNQNLTLTKTITRLGTVVFLLLFNIGISIFVFLLTGIMIFSQVLFIIYAMFLPISFLLSMLPTFSGMGKKAIMKLFNTIMLRAGITLIITVAFSISTMLYTLTIGYPFFLVAFLQMVTFAGIYMKLGDIMSMFSLQSNDSQQVSRRMFRHPNRMMHRGRRRLQRTIGRTVTAGFMAGKFFKNRPRKQNNTTSEQQSYQTENNGSSKQTQNKRPSTFGYRAGQTVGKVMDSKNIIRENVEKKKEQVQNIPSNIQSTVTQPVHDFKEGVADGGYRGNQKEHSSTEQQEGYKNPSSNKQRTNINRPNVKGEKDNKNVSRNKDRTNVPHSNSQRDQGDKNHDNKNRPLTSKPVHDRPTASNENQQSKSRPTIQSKSKPDAFVNQNTRSSLDRDREQSKNKNFKQPVSANKQSVSEKVERDRKQVYSTDFTKRNNSPKGNENRKNADEKQQETTGVKSDQKVRFHRPVQRGKDEK